MIWTYVSKYFWFELKRNQLNVPLEMLLPSYLACTSTLMQNCHVLHPGHNIAIHVVIYGALGMPPSSGKSVVAESCLDRVAIIESYLNKTLPSCVWLSHTALYFHHRGVVKIIDSAYFVF